MQVPQMFAVLTAPPARWPLPWHAAGALACVGLAGLVAAADHAWRIRALAAAQAQLEAARTQAVQARRSTPKPPTEPAPPLAEGTTVQAVLRDLAALATTLSVRIPSLRLDHGQAHAKSYRTVLVALRAQANYPKLKDWLSELQDRYPALAITSLSLRREASDPSFVEADVTLALYLQARP